MYGMWTTSWLVNFNVGKKKKISQIDHKKKKMNKKYNGKDELKNELVSYVFVMGSWGRRQKRKKMNEVQIQAYSQDCFHVFFLFFVFSGFFSPGTRSERRCKYHPRKTRDCRVCTPLEACIVPSVKQKGSAASRSHRIVPTSCLLFRWDRWVYTYTEWNEKAKETVMYTFSRWDAGKLLTVT